MRDYQIITPSLEGVLSHASVVYEGIKRPFEVLRVLDGPRSRGSAVKITAEDKKALAQYFQDLYSVFLKKISSFAVEAEGPADEDLQLQALLQEMLKVKRLMK